MEEKKMESPDGFRAGVLYKANPAALAPYARNVGADAYDQAYGWFVCVSVPEGEPGKYAGKRWMVDTYHIKRPDGFSRNRKKLNDMYIRSAAERDEVSHAFMREAEFGCYRSDCVVLDERTAPLFSEVCDLADMEYIAYDEACEYDEADVVMGVPLFREHGWGAGSSIGSVGICMVRSGAGKRDDLVAAKLMRDMEAAASHVGIARTELAAVESFAAGHPGAIDDASLAAAREAFAVLEETRERLSAIWRSHEAPGQMALDI
jgi:hypothetical protein